MAGSPDRADVLVVGGGPAGAATSYWLAKAGVRVTCVERKTFPRDKTCGDGLTLRILELQPQNGKRMAEASYLAGHPVQVTV